MVRFKVLYAYTPTEMQFIQDLPYFVLEILLAVTLVAATEQLILLFTNGILNKGMKRD